MSKEEVINDTTGEYGGPIEPSDIMYQDDLVCILYPHIKKRNNSIYKLYSTTRNTIFI